MTTTDLRVRRVLAVLGAVLLALGTGALAAWAQTGGWDAPRGVVFAALSAPVWLALALVVSSPDERPEHHEDSVEAQWLTTAASGAFLDLLTVLGLATAATAVLDVDSVPSVFFVVLAMVDVAVRMELQRRREA
jgi:fatty acid desaturase